MHVLRHHKVTLAHRQIRALAAHPILRVAHRSARSGRFQRARPSSSPVRNWAAPTPGTVLKHSRTLTDLWVVAGAGPARCQQRPAQAGRRLAGDRCNALPSPAGCPQRPARRRPPDSGTVRPRAGQRNSPRARRGPGPAWLPGTCPTAATAVDKQAIDRIRDGIQGCPHDGKAAERLPLLFGTEEHLEHHAPPVRMPRPVADPVLASMVMSGTDCIGEQAARGHAVWVTRPPAERGEPGPFG